MDSRTKEASHFELPPFPDLSHHSSTHLNEDHTCRTLFLSFIIHLDPQDDKHIVVTTLSCPFSATHKKHIPAPFHNTPPLLSSLPPSLPLSSSLYLPTTHCPRSTPSTHQYVIVPTPSTLRPSSDSPSNLNKRGSSGVSPTQLDL